MAIGLSSYVTDCVKNDKIPEFVIAKNPFNDLARRRSSSLNNFNLNKVNTMKNEYTSHKPTIVNTTLRTVKTNFNNTNIARSTKVEKDPHKRDYSPILIKKPTKIGNEEKVSSDKIYEAIKNSNLNQENKKARSAQVSKASIQNIAVCNPDIITFSNFRGIRRRHNCIVNTLDSNSNGNKMEGNDSNELNLNKIIFNSIQKKLKFGTEKRNQSIIDTQPIEVDVDRLIKEKRTRTKGIRSDRSKTPVKISNYTDRASITRKISIDLERLVRFSNTNPQEINLEDYITLLNSNIPIKNIIRPFNFKIHLVKLRDALLKNFDIYYSSGAYLHLEIDVQMFCGMDPISKSNRVIWKGQSTNVTALVNNRLSFDIKYCNLPLSSNLIFKIKTSVKVPKEKEKKSSKSLEKKTLAWVNFRLFDHLKRLKTGMHKVSLWDSKFSDDSYFKNLDNYEDSVGECFFELESFARPVEYQNNAEALDFNGGFKPSFTTISSKDQAVIEQIQKRSPFVDLSEEEKEILWRNRSMIIQQGNQDLIPKLLSCVNKKDIPSLSNELEKLLSIAKPIPPIQAMQLLTGNFLEESIRRFAVYSLQQVSPLEVIEYLPQLVQSLKYEIYHDSALANFILKLAIKHPLTIGHSLFWLFKGEMYNANVQQRFGLYLQIFLNKIGENVRKVFEDEVWLINRLLKLADLGFAKGKTEDERNQMLQFEMDSLNEAFCGRSISISYDFKLRVKGVKASKCKFMRSKKKPMWIVFKNADDMGEDIFVIFKKGDDLRQDVLTLQMFKIMHNMWFNENIKLKMSNYNVISTGYFQGMLQIVTKSETLATIHKEFGGLSLGFSNKPLKQWMTKVITNLTEKEYVNNFLVSCAAYCIATFVLGIGDRHNDNIMVKKNGELFHIDFGHFLGHFKYKFGIKRERAPFVFTSEFCNVLGGEKSENFTKFKEICVRSYQVLRKNAEVLITVLKIMLCTGIPELTNNSIKFLEYSLALKLNDKEAENFLLKKLDESLNSLSTKFNFAFHLIANK